MRFGQIPLPQPIDDQLNHVKLEDFFTKQYFLKGKAFISFAFLIEKKFKKLFENFVNVTVLGLCRC